MSYCTACGQTVDDTDRFCAQCGTKVRRDPERTAPAAARPRTEPPTAANGGERSPQRDTARSPQFATMFGVEAESGTTSAPTGGSGVRRVVLVPVVLAAFVASGWLGYWWFSRTAAPAETAAHLETEGVIDARSDASGRPAESLGESPSAWTLIGDATRDARAAGEVGLTPDGRTAVIASGGALALAWAGEFYNGNGPDLRIFGSEGDRTRYTLYVRVHSDTDWVRFDTSGRAFSREGTPHDFGHHGIDSARQILIRNDSAANLYVDAIAPLHTTPMVHSDAPGAHRDPR